MSIVSVQNKSLSSLRSNLIADVAKASTPSEEQTIYSVYLHSVDEVLKAHNVQASTYRKFKEEVKTTLNAHHKANPDIHLSILGAPNSHYINLDGANDYLSMQNVPAGVLDYTSTWALGIELENVSTVNDSSYTTLFKRGTNEITLRKGGTSNWGVYFYANGQSVAQANTWVAPGPGSKVLFTCNGSQVKYYLNGSLRSTTSLNANVSHNNASGDLTFGQGGPKGSYWYGGVNNMMVMTNASALGSNQLTEYFASQDVSKMSFYAGDVIDFLPLGERTYNTLSGQKGIITGSLENATTSDFVERP
jgi:hypothetical protein